MRTWLSSFRVHDGTFPPKAVDWMTLSGLSNVWKMKLQLPTSA